VNELAYRQLISQFLVEPEAVAGTVNDFIRASTGQCSEDELEELSAYIGSARQVALLHLCLLLFLDEFQFRPPGCTLTFLAKYADDSAVDAAIAVVGRWSSDTPSESVEYVRQAVMYLCRFVHSNAHAADIVRGLSDSDDEEIAELAQFFFPS
jgi:hypothetical protein